MTTDFAEARVKPSNAMRDESRKVTIQIGVFLYSMTDQHLDYLRLSILRLT